MHLPRGRHLLVLDFLFDPTDAPAFQGFTITILFPLALSCESSHFVLMDLEFFPPPVIRRNKFFLTPNGFPDFLLPLCYDLAFCRPTHISILIPAREGVTCRRK